MKITIVYESMFGGTRAIAEAIGEGCGQWADVEVVSVADADPGMVDRTDVLVVGGPTHAWGMSRPSTRKGAPGYRDKPGSDLVLEPGAETGPGVREWLAGLGQTHAHGAAFDTRIKGPSALTGRASRGIKRHLSKRGFDMITRPESFLVTRRSHLVEGEIDRARVWGSQLATLMGGPRIDAHGARGRRG